ncbi:MAG: maleylpyruvate isomerase family mycothiol-dependent enzyme [Micromonosporaceae bacterium]
MDYVGHFRREATAFEAAAHAAAGLGAAPAVSSCPGWVVTGLVLHLGTAHRSVARVLRERMQQPPQMGGDRSWLGLPDEWVSWLPPGCAPKRAPMPAALAGWFHEGAAALEEQFRTTATDERVWTWSANHSAGFWQRMQAIEAAVHRWDAENALGEAHPIDAALAADAVGQTLDIMAPMGRHGRQRPVNAGGRFSAKARWPSR